MGPTVYSQTGMIKETRIILGAERSLALEGFPETTFPHQIGKSKGRANDPRRISILLRSRKKTNKKTFKGFVVAVI